MAYSVERLESLATEETETLNTISLSSLSDWQSGKTSEKSTVRSIIVFKAKKNRRPSLQRSSTLASSPPYEWYNLKNIFQLRRASTFDLEEVESDEDKNRQFSVYLEQVSSNGGAGTTILYKLFMSHSKQEAALAVESLKRTLQPFADLLVIPVDLLKLLVLPQPKTLLELPDTIFDYLKSDDGGNAKYDMSAIANLHINSVSLAYHACISGKDQILRILLEMGADMFYKDHTTGDGLVHISAKYSHSCLVMVLNAVKQVCSRQQYLDFINRVNHSNLDSKRLAQPRKKHGMVKLALSEMSILSLAVYKISPEPHRKFGSGVSPLMLACYEENVKSVGILLSEGANPNVKDPSRGTTALHVAAETGNVPIMQLLLVFGAQLDNRNSDDETPLDLAEKKMYQAHENDTEECIQILEMVRLLRERSDSIWGNVKKPENAKSGKVLLSVDGGGTRMLIPAFILHFLEKRMSVVSGKPNLKISRYFNWLSGTSAGSALTLAMVYNHSTPAQVLTSVIAERDKLFSGKRIYAEEGLEDFVKGVVGDKAFIDEIKEPKVIVPTTLSNCSPPKCVLINNYQNNEDNKRRWKAWEAVRASAAAPTYFPAFEMKYVDGGLMAPNPTLATMTEALDHSDNQPLALVLSLGTGNAPSVNVDHLDAVVPRLTSLVSDIKQDLQYVSRLTELLMANLSNQDPSVSHARTWCRSMGTSFYRLSPDMTTKYALDTKEDPPMAETLFNTYIYCLENAEIIETIALQLLEHGLQHNH